MLIRTRGGVCRTDFGEAAAPVESALAQARTPSPGDHCALSIRGEQQLLAEIYVNMSIVDASRPRPYDDTQIPKRFGTVSSLDPQMFLPASRTSPTNCSRNKPSGKYSPAEVRRDSRAWRDRASKQLFLAEAKIGDRKQAQLPTSRDRCNDPIRARLFLADKMRSGGALCALHAQRRFSGSQPGFESISCRALRMGGGRFAG